MFPEWRTSIVSYELSTDLCVRAIRVIRENLIDYVEFSIRHQNLWNPNSFFALIILQDCCYNSRQGQRAAIEGMKQLSLAIFVFVAQLQPVALEGLEIADGAYLQPAFLRGAPNLHVVREGAGEAHVAAAKQ